MASKEAQKEEKNKEYSQKYQTYDSAFSWKQR